MHKELKQMSPRKKNLLFFFSIPASECYFREASVHRPGSYILPMCLSACSHVASPAKTGSFWCQRPVLLIGGTPCLSFVGSLFLPSSFQSERSEVRVASDTGASRGF